MSEAARVCGYSSETLRMAKIKQSNMLLLSGEPNLEKKGRHQTRV